MDPEKVYQLIKSSPEIVGRHDREAWLGLFSQSAVVQDPVGAGPNRKGQGVRDGRDELARFYDIFIASNDIKFTVNQDIVIGNEAVRDILISTVMPNGASCEIPALVKYSVIEEGGELKIDKLNAHWDLSKNSLNMIKNNGIKGVVASCKQFGTMIKVQGMPRVLEYCQTMHKGILGKGIKTVQMFAEAVSESDKDFYDSLVDQDATIEFPIGMKLSPNGFFNGEAKDMKLEVSALRSGGWFTAGVFDAQPGGKHGVVFFQFHPETKKIFSARFFWNRHRKD